jgi:hypothetical protein
MQVATRRRFAAILGTAALVATGAAVVPQASQAAPATPGRFVSARNCPRPFPVRAVHRGMRATGYTTVRGQRPSPFRARVLGVLKDGVAPGIDLIVIRANSPTIRHVGGIWEGMSGSPIYAPDGRLLGALAYSFSFGPSHTAGVTPAVDMYKLFRIGRGKAGIGQARHVQLNSRMRSQLVRTGNATPRQAAGGLRPIPTPITVSGVPAQGLRKVHKLMSKVLTGPFSLRTGGGVHQPLLRRPPSSVPAHHSPHPSRRETSPSPGSARRQPSVGDGYSRSATR